MRVQLSPHKPLHTKTITGYKISPQPSKPITITLKSSTLPQTNYEQILDDGKSSLEPFPPNILPINFCHTPGEYNKLLITNGKKVSSTSYQQTIGTNVPTVEFLNIECHRRNQEKQDRMKEVYLIKEEERRRLTVGAELGECICCCCDQFCRFCDQEMHVNFDEQKVKSHVPKMIRAASAANQGRSERVTKSPRRKIIKIGGERYEEGISKSEKARKDKVNKKKGSEQFSIFDEPDEYHRIKPLLQRSIEKQKQISQQKHIKNPRTIAQTKIQRIKLYDQHRRIKSPTVLSLETPQRDNNLPWNYNVRKQKPSVDKYCHKHHEPTGITYVKKPIKPQPKTLCHPTGFKDKNHIELLRKHYGEKAHEKMNEERERKIEKKIKLTQNLRKLDEQRREIIEKTVKQKFKPTKGDIEKAFNEQGTN